MGTHSLRHLTPLRYPGGKAKLAPHFRKIFELNHLCDGVYVEPYAGGAGVALDLLILEYVREIYLNDLDPGVYKFWKAVLDHTETLCRMIKDTRINITSWKQQKETLRNQSNHSIIDVAFAFLFLNRTNRSGIVRGGPIGGINQNGNWKIDARYNVDGLIARIEKIARYRSRIQLSNKDALEFLTDITTALQGDTLIYLDPPYYAKGQRLYRNTYEHSDHAALADFVTSSLGHQWVVSYDDLPEIRKLYRGQKRTRYTLSYSAREYRQGNEIIFYSPSLRIPSGAPWKAPH